MVPLILGAELTPRAERALSHALEVPALHGTSCSVLVGDPAAPTFARDPERRVVPASTVKLVTAVAALRRLGPDAVLRTELAVSGDTLGEVLRGDVVLVGGFDPSLGDPDALEVGRWVTTTLRELGVARVEGRVVVDGSAWQGAPLGRGWMWDDLGEPWSAPYGAVNVGHNVGGAGTAACARRAEEGSPLLEPAGCLAEVVRSALDADGFRPTGAAVGRVPEAVVVDRLDSAPLAELLAHTLEVSDNLYAEAIWAALGGNPDASREVVQSVLREVGSADPAPVDGSGLSRYDHLSADSLVRALVAEPSVVALLPVAGGAGTLGKRLVGTVAEGRVHAKTGSMTGVRNLVGVVDLEGGQLPFAFLIDGLAAPQAEAIAAQDRFLELLASLRRTRGGRWRLPRAGG